MKTIYLLVASLLFFVPFPADAQPIPSDSPGAVQKRESDIREFYELKRRMEEAQEPRPKDGVSDRTKETPPVADGGQRIFIRQIVTNRSDILSDEELRAVLSPYEGKEETIRELFAAVEKINDLYRQKGYFTARAILPPQKVEGGTVHIRLVEGRVGTVTVEGNRYTWDWYFTSRIGLEEGDLVRLGPLEQDLFFFNATNDVQVRAEVKPGARTGTTDVILKAQEPGNFRVSLFGDNAGGKTVGQERFGLSLQDVSLFGMRDPLTLSGIVADGTMSGHVSYSLPVTPVGTRIGLAYDYSHTWVTSGAYESLDVEGDSSVMGLTLSQPLWMRPSLSTNGFMGFYWKKSTSDLDDVTIFQTRTRTFAIGGDLLSVDAYGSWFTRHSLTQGFKDFGGDRSFFKYNGDVVRTLNLPAEFTALFRASGQASGNKLLPSSEQFQVGGMATVRGFYEGLLIGDDGYFVSGEVNCPLFPQDTSLFDLRLRPLVRGAFFVDHGGAFPFKGAGDVINHNDFLTSAGFGLIVNLTKYFSGRVDFAFPLVDREPDAGTFRVHFSLQSEIL